MSALNPSGWQPNMGGAQGASGELVTSSGDRGLTFEEPLSFEIGAIDKCGVDLDEPDGELAAALGKFLRKSAPDLPGLTEPETVRHYSRLSPAELRHRPRPVPAWLVYDEAQSAAQ